MDASLRTPCAGTFDHGNFSPFDPGPGRRTVRIRRRWLRLERSGRPRPVAARSPTRPARGQGAGALRNASDGLPVAPTIRVLSPDSTSVLGIRPPTGPPLSRLNELTSVPFGRKAHTFAGSPAEASAPPTNRPFHPHSALLG